MITTQTDIDEYFDKDTYKTDEKVKLENDIYTLSLFLKSLIQKLGGKVTSSQCSFDRWAWRPDQQITKHGNAFRVTNKKSSIYFMITSTAVEPNLYVDCDSKGCFFIKFAKTRRSIKVSEDSIIVNSKWLIPMLSQSVTDGEEKIIDKKLADFQTELLIPWMVQMLIDNNIPEDNIETTGKAITIKGFERNAYYSFVTITTWDMKSTDNFEDREWSINFKSKLWLSGIKSSNIISILKNLKESGYFKKIV